MYFMLRGPASPDLVTDDMYSEHMLQAWSLAGCAIPVLEILPQQRKPVQDMLSEPFGQSRAGTWESRYLGEWLHRRRV